MEVALTVNIDFEEVLFRHETQPHLNESLEFLSLWVDPRPLLTKKKYPHFYSEYLEAKSGFKPRFKSEGKHIHWWGDLSHPEILKVIAQKSFSFRFFEKSWRLEGVCPKSWKEVELFLVKHKKCVLKSEGKMSGRGHRIIGLEDLSKLAFKPIEDCVLEPYYDREKDISALYVDDEKRFIYYQNEIDQKFQWRSNSISPDLKVEERWTEDLELLRRKISDLGYLGLFSVDAFYYKVLNDLKFYPGSEVNPRKTMGWVNYKLFLKRKAKASLLGLETKKLNELQWKKLSENTSVLLLSPPENKFVIYWIEADSTLEIDDKRKAFLEQLLRA